MKSDLPKVLHRLLGSLCWNMFSVVLEPSHPKDCNGCGPQGWIGGASLSWTNRVRKQTELLGTGHAVMIAETSLGSS